MRISVVIPVRNEERSIAALLDGLLAQTRRPDEIVITDGGSTDATAEIITYYLERGAPIELIRSGPALPGRGRNLASARAKGDWLAYIDAGVWPAADWLERLSARVAKDPKLEVVYGGLTPVTNTRFKMCAAIAYVPAPKRVNGVLVHPPVLPSSLIRKTVWEKVGGFPEDLRSAEDLLFMQRIAEGGYSVAHEPAAMVWWELQPTPWSTFKRFVTYAENNIRAGLWFQWQGPLLRRYAFLAFSALLAALVFGGRGLWLTPVLWLGMMSARAIVSLWRHRHVDSATASQAALRILILVPLLAWLDLAALVGSVLWLIRDRRLHRPIKSVRLDHGA